MKKILLSILFVAICAIASSETFELRITMTGEGSGKVVGKSADGTTVTTCEIQPPNECIRQLAPDTITLTATPAPSHTLQWTDGTGSATVCNGSAPCTFKLNTNSRIIAVFRPPSALTVRVTGPGKATFKANNGVLLTVDSGTLKSAFFFVNSRVSINAIPDSGSNFTGWTVIQGSPAGAMCGANANPCSFVIDKQIIVEAKFITPPVTINVSKTGSGTVTDSAGMNCGADCSSSVSAGTTITLKALPSSGFTFRNWSNGTGSATVCNNSTTAICRFAVSQNSTITANFLAN